MDKLEQFEKDEREMLDADDVELDMNDVELESESTDKKNTTFLSFFENKKYIAEQINAKVANGANGSTGVENRYILYDKLKNTHKVVKDYKDGVKTYTPIKSKLIDKGSIYLPTGVEEYENLENIIEDIKNYYNSYFEAPEFFQEFLPYYTLFTWVYDKFPFIPYLHFVGRTSTGKSWTAETVASLCYKAIDAAGSVTIASLFRSVDDWGGTIYLDEFDLKNFGSEGYTAMENFMKAGVSDRSILRVEGKNKRQVTPYTVKSPKIFTSETPISAPGLQSRTIVIQMEKNKRRLPLYKLSDYHEKGEQIRNKLLLWRLRTFNNINLKEIEYGFKELEKLDRRVQQVLTPIYYLAGNEAKKKILNFAKKQEEETKRQRRETEDGSVAIHIYNYFGFNSSNPKLKDITEQINKEREADGYKTKRTERKIGQIVRKILGFETAVKGHDNLTEVLVEENQEKLEELKDYYGFEDTVTTPVQPFASLATLATGTNEKNDEFDETIKDIFGEDVKSSKTIK